MIFKDYRSVDMRIKRLFVSIVILFLSGGWVVYSHFHFPVVQMENLEAPQKGFQSPTFSLYGLDGTAHSLSEYRGRPVIVNFWASWCTPCVKEMPTLQNVYADYSSEGLVMLGVNMTWQDTKTEIGKFIEKRGITFPVLLDSQGTVSQLYRVQALPTTFFIGVDGRITDVIVGGPIPDAAIRAKVTHLIERTP